MNQLQIIGKQKVAGYEFTGIEGGFGHGKKAMLVKEIAEIHGKEVKHINLRINENRSRFKNGIDIVDLKVSPFGGPSLEQLGFTKQSISNSKNIYLLSERGYAKLLKILEDDKTWELYDKLVDGYFNMRKQHIDTTQLSPELQMFQTLFTTLATQELNQKKLEQKVDNISEIVALNSTDWRKDTTSILNKIARKQGGFEMYRKIRNESYEILEQRASAKLSIRVNNKKKSMALEGVSKSKIDKVSNLDIIGEEKRLLEIYLAIVKEMAIRYQVSINEAI
ncbi:ORF6N domain-containing protein [Bacillus wiedmannii]|uniref:ORF6N domain-containing protein n=1 Tax=Bacillus wiedmannii TaxID=1890302 RepID=UPI0021CE5FD0|nr:ORF6N domain-containing protein [Bacillus wiedmannii]MCU5706099.1 ORF6N domain-containing protein [Bacillus wiedmannii]